jgi:hypothetical protein
MAMNLPEGLNDGFSRYLYQLDREERVNTAPIAPAACGIARLNASFKISFK